MKPRSENLESAKTVGEKDDTGVDSRDAPSAVGVTSVLPPESLPDRLGGFKVLAELGSGGMGRVLLAEDQTLGRQVAIKIMRGDLATIDSNRQRFLREARLAAALQHDHIVTIHHVGEHDGTPFLVMERLAGTSLEDYLKACKPLSMSQIVRIGREVAKGLGAAHDRGLIHRDIKPSNLWLTAPSGRVKILDFGLARDDVENVGLTADGAIVGTPTYMSPEQARGERVDGRGDLFSLGVVLYRLCTGQLPFAGKNVMAVLAKIASDTPQPPRELNSTVPTELSDLVMRLLAKSPDERPKRAKEVVAVLTAIDKQLRDASLATTATDLQAAPRAAASAAVNAEKTLNATALHVKAPLRRPTGPKSILLGVAGVALTALVVWQIVIRVVRPYGKTTEIIVPDRSTVNVAADGKKTVETKDNAKPAGKSEKPPQTPAFPPLDKAWRARVTALTGEERAREVVAELKRRNPDFDGQMKSQVIGNDVFRLELNTMGLQDIEPLRVLQELQMLFCNPAQNARNNARALTDITPLSEMKLAFVDLSGNRELADIGPLRGLPLDAVYIHQTSVSSLEPLRGMPVRQVSIYETPVRDLSPIVNPKLEAVYSGNGPVQSLEPLRGAKLQAAHLPAKLLRDDPSILDGMPLIDLAARFDPANAADVALLRKFPKLELIELRPAAEFWEKVRAAEQKK